jgi:CRISPR system Cascade subunit CasB
MSNSYLQFGKDSPESQALTAWWRKLDVNRGDRAELRRCGTPAEVVFTPAYHRLRHDVIRFGAVRDDNLATIAGLAARVKSNAVESTIAEQMASGKGDSSKARVSGLRFRRLLKVKDQEELFLALGRVIALLGGSINLQSMAQSVYFWNDRTRKQWAFDYYSKAPSED